MTEYLIVKGVVEFGLLAFSCWLLWEIRTHTKPKIRKRRTKKADAE